MADNPGTIDPRAEAPDKGQQEQHEQQEQRGPSIYELEVDRQVEKYLDLKHSLTIFLITAAVGSLGFTLNFAVQHLDKISDHPERITFLAAGSVLGLVTAAFLLYALDRDMVSFQYHLRMRYEHKSYEQLPSTEQKAWDRDIGKAKLFRTWATVSLFLSIMFQAVLLMSFVLY